MSVRQLAFWHQIHQLFLKKRPVLLLIPAPVDILPHFVFLLTRGLSSHLFLLCLMGSLCFHLFEFLALLIEFLAQRGGLRRSSVGEKDVLAW